MENAKVTINVDTASTPKTLETGAQIESRVRDEKLMPLEKDRQIALSLYDKLNQRFAKGEMTETQHAEALTALNTLIPTFNEKGWRKIADINISPAMETTIKSRLDSKEHDLTDPNESWGKLPLVVKQEIAKHSNMIIEMTGTCTVRCSFCAFADKGPIQDKISLNSLGELLRFFKDNQKISWSVSKTDSLYWGTDPFDAKWKGTDTDYDYSDVANLYWNTMNPGSRSLYTSTAMPIGEELRIVNFADKMLEAKKNGKASKFTMLRLSRTNANTKRVDAVEKIISALHGTVSEKDLEFSTNRNENEAKSGKKWEGETGLITTWDILGPNCRDDVVVGVHRVDSVVMEASSNERPQGESRLPILDADSTDDVQTYTIPHHTEKPDNFEGSMYSSYPNIVVTKIRIEGGKASTVEMEIKDNPHRAFLRMVGVLQGLFKKHTENKVPKEAKEEYKNRLSEELQLIQGYLDLGGNNTAMVDYIKYFKARGYI